MATALERAESRLRAVQAAPAQTPELESKDIDPAPESSLEISPEPTLEPEVPANDEITSIKEELRKSKAAFSTLQGMFKAEVAKATESVMVKVKDLENKLAIAETERDMPARKAAISERFGDDADKIAEYVQNELKAATKPLNDELESIKSRQTKSDDRTFFSTLKMLVPDYVEVNSSPDWINWLESPDEYGDIPNDVLVQAQQAGDVLKVSKVFNKYKKNLVKPDVKKPDKSVLLAPGKGRGQSREETPQVTVESLGKLAQALKKETDPRKRAILQDQFYKAHKIFKETEDAARGFR